MKTHDKLSEELFDLRAPPGNRLEALSGGSLRTAQYMNQCSVANLQTAFDVKQAVAEVGAQILREVPQREPAAA